MRKKSSYNLHFPHDNPFPNRKKKQSDLKLESTSSKSSTIQVNDVDSSTSQEDFLCLDTENEKGIIYPSVNPDTDRNTRFSSKITKGNDDPLWILIMSPT